MHRYFLLNKPWNMVSQFVSTYEQPTLADLGFDFPEGIHAIGRLDLHSEGLLLLTTDKRVTSLLFNGPVSHPRTYHVQVQGVVSDDSVAQLRSGIPFIIRGGKDYVSAPCEADIVPDPGFGFESGYELNSYISYTWLRMTLHEGKFHQVRKMVRAVGHPCVRLVRTSIAGLRLGTLAAGEVREIGGKEFFDALRLQPG